MKYRIQTFNYNSEEYRKALQLRYRVLRKPLKLEFTEAELKRDKEDTHFGLFEGEEMVACLILAKAGEKRMKMRQVAVYDAFQSKGLGKELSNAAEKFAKESGCSVIFCNARKVAVPFYEKMGYKIVSDEFTEVNIPHYTMEKQL